MTTRTCATCGSRITVTTRNPNRRFCSSRCRVADWHAHHRRNVVANAVHTCSEVPKAVPAANGVTKWPHCRHDLAVVAVVIPADAARVSTPEVIT